MTYVIKGWPIFWSSYKIPILGILFLFSSLGKCLIVRRGILNLKNKAFTYRPYCEKDATGWTTKYPILTLDVSVKYCVLCLGVNVYHLEVHRVSSSSHPFKTWFQLCTVLTQMCCPTLYFSTLPMPAALYWFGQEMFLLWDIVIHDLLGA